jgi:pseudaminic acid synthase
MEKGFEIAGRKIGPGHPVFVVAEMSANHHQDFDEAVRIIQAAKKCGADAVKLQHYTPDTITIDSDQEYFKVKGTIWDGETLHSLYRKAYMPWEWTPRLKEVADDVDIVLFSTPFDRTAVDYLEDMEVPAYKVASFELVDISLIEHIASRGKPVIMSTGMAELDEIKEAVEAARGAGAKDIALLKCTSDYPATPEEMNLLTIPHLAKTFGVVAGLSDHTMGIAVPIASVALGASIIEKHFTLSRDRGGPDAAFSFEPEEFGAMVDAVRTTEKALGAVHYGLTEKEKQSRVFRRSLFVVKDMKAGDEFTEENVRSIRPGHGLHPKHLKEIIGKKATRDIKKGSPLAWEITSR